MDTDLPETMCEVGEGTDRVSGHSQITRVVPLCGIMSLRGEALRGEVHLNAYSCA